MSSKVPIVDQAWEIYRRDLSMRIEKIEKDINWDDEKSLSAKLADITREKFKDEYVTKNHKDIVSETYDYIINKITKRLLELNASKVEFINSLAEFRRLVAIAIDPARIEDTRNKLLDINNLDEHSEAVEADLTERLRVVTSYRDDVYKARSVIKNPNWLVISEEFRTEDAKLVEPLRIYEEAAITLGAKLKVVSKNIRIIKEKDQALETYKTAIETITNAEYTLPDNQPTKDNSHLDAIPSLNALQEEFKTAIKNVIAITVDEKYADMDEFKVITEERVSFVAKINSLISIIIDRIALIEKLNKIRAQLTAWTTKYKTAIDKTITEIPAIGAGNFLQIEDTLNGIYSDKNYTSKVNLWTVEMTDPEGVLKLVTELRVTSGEPEENNYAEIRDYDTMIKTNIPSYKDKVKEYFGPVDSTDTRTINYWKKELAKELVLLEKDSNANREKITFVVTYTEDFKKGINVLNVAGEILEQLKTVNPDDGDKAIADHISVHEPYWENSAIPTIRAFIDNYTATYREYKAKYDQYKASLGQQYNQDQATVKQYLTSGKEYLDHMVRPVYSDETLLSKGQLDDINMTLLSYNAITKPLINVAYLTIPAVAELKATIDKRVDDIQEWLLENSNHKEVLAIHLLVEKHVKEATEKIEALNAIVVDVKSIDCRIAIETAIHDLQGIKTTLETNLTSLLRFKTVLATSTQKTVRDKLVEVNNAIAQGQSSYDEINEYIDTRNKAYDEYSRIYNVIIDDMQRKPSIFNTTLTNVDINNWTRYQLDDVESLNAIKDIKDKILRGIDLLTIYEDSKTNGQVILDIDNAASRYHIYDYHPKFRTLDTSIAKLKDLLIQAAKDIDAHVITISQRTTEEKEKIRRAQEIQNILDEIRRKLKETIMSGNPADFNYIFRNLPKVSDKALEELLKRKDLLEKLLAEITSARDDLEPRIKPLIQDNPVLKESYEKLLEEIRAYLERMGVAKNLLSNKIGEVTKLDEQYKKYIEELTKIITKINDSNEIIITTKEDILRKGSNESVANDLITKCKAFLEEIDPYIKLTEVDNIEDKLYPEVLQTKLKELKVKKAAIELTISLLEVQKNVGKYNNYIKDMGITLNTYLNADLNIPSVTEVTNVQDMIAYRSSIEARIELYKTEPKIQNIPALDNMDEKDPLASELRISDYKSYKKQRDDQIDRLKGIINHIEEQMKVFKTEILAQFEAWKVNISKDEPDVTYSNYNSLKTLLKSIKKTEDKTFEDLYKDLSKVYNTHPEFKFTLNEELNKENGTLADIYSDKMKSLSNNLYTLDLALEGINKQSREADFSGPATIEEIINSQIAYILAHKPIAGAYTYPTPENYASIPPKDKLDEADLDKITNGDLYKDLSKMFDTHSESKPTISTSSYPTLENYVNILPKDKLVYVLKDKVDDTVLDKITNNLINASGLSKQYIDLLGIYNLKDEYLTVFATIRTFVKEYLYMKAYFVANVLHKVIKDVIEPVTNIYNKYIGVENDSYVTDHDTLVSALMKDEAVKEFSAKYDEFDKVYKGDPSKVTLKDGYATIKNLVEVLTKDINLIKATKTATTVLTYDSTNNEYILADFDETSQKVIDEVENNINVSSVVKNCVETWLDAVEDVCDQYNYILHQYSLATAPELTAKMAELDTVLKDKLSALDLAKTVAIDLNSLALSIDTAHLIDKFMTLVYPTDLTTDNSILTIAKTPTEYLENTVKPVIDKYKAVYDKVTELFTHINKFKTNTGVDLLAKENHHILNDAMKDAYSICTVEYLAKFHMVMSHADEYVTKFIALAKARDLLDNQIYTKLTEEISNKLSYNWVTYTKEHLNDYSENKFTLATTTIEDLIKLSQKDKYWSDLKADLVVPERIYDINYVNAKYFTIRNAEDGTTSLVELQEQKVAALQALLATIAKEKAAFIADKEDSNKEVQLLRKKNSLLTDLTDHDNKYKSLLADSTITALNTERQKADLNVLNNEVFKVYKDGDGWVNKTNAVIEPLNSWKTAIESLDARYNELKDLLVDSNELYSKIINSYKALTADKEVLTAIISFVDTLKGKVTEFKTFLNKVPEDGHLVFPDTFNAVEDIPFTKYQLKDEDFNKLSVEELKANKEALVAIKTYMETNLNIDTTNNQTIASNAVDKIRDKYVADRGKVEANSIEAIFYDNIREMFRDGSDYQAVMDKKVNIVTQLLVPMVTAKQTIVEPLIKKYEDRITELNTPVTPETHEGETHTVDPTPEHKEDPQPHTEPEGHTEQPTGEDHKENTPAVTPDNKEKPEEVHPDETHVEPKEDHPEPAVKPSEDQPNVAPESKEGSETHTETSNPEEHKDNTVVTPAEDHKEDTHDEGETQPVEKHDEPVDEPKETSKEEPASEEDHKEEHPVDQNTPKEDNAPKENETTDGKHTEEKPNEVHSETSSESSSNNAEHSDTTDDLK